MKVARFHLVGYLISGAARLRDHIERIDDGAAYAMDDLAVVLRLLVSGVSGGQLISRTAQSFGIPLPKIGISAEPEPIQGLVWGAGALPTAETLGTAGLADINQLRFKTALRIQTGSKRMDLTWDKLIRDYASYWGGAHVGESIRDDVHLADRIGTAAGLPLITYMLREIAVAAWYSAQFVLRNAMIQDDPEFFRDPDVEDGEGETWLSLPGGIHEPPKARAELGKFQSCTSAGSAASWVWAVEYPAAEGQTLGELYIGGLTHQIKLQAEHGSLEKEYDVSRQRTPIHPDVSFSQGKTVTVTPQFRRWDSETYMVGMSRFINQAVPMIRG